MFYCEIPYCSYSTENRNKINYHHIIPKELKGNNKKYNRIYLCPNHHDLVYVHGSKIGNHSIKSKDSIIILEWFSSTDGRIFRFVDVDGIIKFSKAKNYV